MNKQELLQALSQKTGLNKRDAQKLLSALGEIITETLVSGERLQLTGFGTFDTVGRSARTARNPRTGEPVEVSASRTPALFKKFCKRDFCDEVRDFKIPEPEAVAS